MDRRELLATGGISLIAIAGCLGTYKVVRQTGLMPDGSESGAGSNSDSDEIGPQPSDDDDGPLADNGNGEDDSPLEDGENSDNESEPVTDDTESNDSDELYEPDDGPLLDDENSTDGTESNENNEREGNETDRTESSEEPDDRPEDPTEHVTWVETDYEIFETEYGDSEVIILGKIRNETGYDLSYLRVGGQGYLDGDLVTENSIEIAGLAAGDTLTVEIPLYVEPEAIDEYRYGVWEAEYVEE